MSEGRGGGAVRGKIAYHVVVVVAVYQDHIPL